MSVEVSIKKILVYMLLTFNFEPNFDNIVLEILLLITNSSDHWTIWTIYLNLDQLFLW